METLYTEGLATHGDPESCVGVREDVGEALTGYVQAGLLSHEIYFRVPTLFKQAEGNTASAAIARCWGTRRGRRT